MLQIYQADCFLPELVQAIAIVVVVQQCISVIAGKLHCSQQGMSHLDFAVFFFFIFCERRAEIKVLCHTIPLLAEPASPDAPSGPGARDVGAGAGPGASGIGRYSRTPAKPAAVTLLRSTSSSMGHLRDRRSRPIEAVSQSVSQSRRQGHTLSMAALAIESLHGAQPARDAPTVTCKQRAHLRAPARACARVCDVGFGDVEQARPRTKFLRVHSVYAGTGRTCRAAVGALPRGVSRARPAE